MAKTDPERGRGLEAYANAKRRAAEEIFARVHARLEGRHRDEHERHERRRRLLRLLTPRRTA